MNPKAAILSLWCFWAGAAGAHVLTIGNGQEFTTIHLAIAAAKPGDTLFVKAGNYKEGNIAIEKRLTLIGENHPVLDGENKFEILSVRADGVSIRGFRILLSGVSSLQDLAGIKVYNARDVVIADNILEATFFGIYIQSGKNCTIRNNQLQAYGTQEQQSGNGIHCWKCDSLLIINNRVSGHRDGIYFEFVTHSLIWRNVSTGNLRYGLHFMFSHEDAYIANIFSANGAGVSVMFTHGVKMFHNFFDNNRGDGAFGLLLKEISDSYVSGNYFTNNTAAIYMEGASRVQLENNEFRNNGWALKIQASCLDIAVNRNNFQGNSFDVATNGSLVLNNFNLNYWDKYQGYDLNRDQVGDIPYRPVSLFSVIAEKNPAVMILFRSFMVSLLDQSEKVIPSLTPENLMDETPRMKPFRL